MHDTMQASTTACRLHQAGHQMTCRKEAHPEQWLGGLGGLKRLAVCTVGGQSGVLDKSRHGAVDLDPCKAHAWSGIAGSLRLSLTSAQSPSRLHRDSAEE